MAGILAHMSFTANSFMANIKMSTESDAAVDKLLRVQSNLPSKSATQIGSAEGAVGQLIHESASTNQSRRTQMFTRFFCAVACAVLCASAAAAGDLSTDRSRVTVVFDRTLPNVPGKSIKGVLVEYPPGGSSPAHTHPDSSFIYATVLEGAIRSKINDEPEKVYRAGESFAEVPGDHHGVSANASDTQPARLLAVFVVNTDEKNLVRDDKPEGSKTKTGKP
nr:cupin domain-containing protein [Gloeobacter morelensis]